MPERSGGKSRGLVCRQGAIDFEQAPRHFKLEPLGLVSWNKPAGDFALDLSQLIGIDLKPLAPLKIALSIDKPLPERQDQHPANQKHKHKHRAQEMKFRCRHKHNGR